MFSGKAVTISCTDPHRSSAFYRNVLGAVPLPGDGYGCQWYRLGELVFSIMPNAEAGTPASFPRDAMAMLWLEVDDLAAAHRHLKKAKVRIVDAPDGGPYLMIADPDGLMIEVWVRDDDADADDQ